MFVKSNQESKTKPATAAKNPFVWIGERLTEAERISAALSSNGQPLKQASWEEVSNPSFCASKVVRLSPLLGCKAQRFVEAFSLTNEDVKRAVSRHRASLCSAYYKYNYV